jgi:hypothetical protein
MQAPMVTVAALNSVCCQYTTVHMLINYRQLALEIRCSTNTAKLYCKLATVAYTRSRRKQKQLVLYDCTVHSSMLGTTALPGPLLLPPAVAAAIAAAVAALSASSSSTLNNSHISEPLLHPAEESSHILVLHNAFSHCSFADIFMRVLLDLTCSAEPLKACVEHAN